MDECLEPSGTNLSCVWRSQDNNIGMNLLTKFWKMNWKDFYTRFGRTHFKPDGAQDQGRVGDSIHQRGVDALNTHYPRDRETSLGKAGQGQQAIKNAEVETIGQVQWKTQCKLNLQQTKLILWCDIEQLVKANFQNWWYGRRL